MARRAESLASANAKAAPATQYSIRVVASRTGIPVETLRVWERRYGFPAPARRAGGGRLYGDEDVARLTLIARARDAGYRPGDVIALPDQEIVRLLEGAPTSPATTSLSPATGITPDIEALVDAVRRDEVARVRGSLRSLAITLGPKAFVTEVAHPLAVRIGEEWERGSLEVRHEHLATALLSMQLRLLLSAFEDSEAAPIVVLATLPGEAHALGLEMVAVYLAAQRATSRLLGADTPPDQIARAAHAMQAHVVGISVSAAHHATATRAHVDELFRRLHRKETRATELWVGGAGATRIALRDPRLRITTSWEAIDAALQACRARQERSVPRTK